MAVRIGRNMIQKLDFAEPFFSVDYIENEEEYYIEKNSMAVNLAERSGSLMYIRGVPVLPLKAAIAEGVWLEHVERAFVVKDYERCDLEDISTTEAIKAAWKSIYECSGIERHRGLPYYKSPKFCTGEGRNHIEINFCYVAQPDIPSGPHRDHDRDFDEVHAQIRGFGKMQKFNENDVNTYFGEYIMAPGIVHDKFYDGEGKYPWHQYRSITPCVYCPIEIDR